MKRISKWFAVVFTAAMIMIVAACKPEPEPHVHTFSEDWTNNPEYHWHAASCGEAEHNVDFAAHTWNHSDYQYDSTSKKDTRTCTVCDYIDEKVHVHTEENSGAVTKNATTTSAGVKTYKCTICSEDVRKELYCGPLGTDGNAATSSSTYIYFGVFPKTIKASSITVDETVSIKMGANTYYKGSDGEWYAKVTANPFKTDYTYSDTTTITKGNTDYFKVEPIKWKVLTTDYNSTKKALLLAEEILTASVPYYKYNSSSNKRTVGSDTGIYPNNYKYSQIRAYLNGLDYYYDTSSTETTKKTDYTDKGFLQTAFTADAQTLIAQTTVDNSASSTTDTGNNITEATSYICDNTTDKIFLLSEKEVTTTAYGFAAYSASGTGNARIRFPTDYAMANYAYQSKTSGYGGFWWLRSPYDDDSSIARHVRNDGDASRMYVHNSQIGVVPALSISF